ncbi:MAG: sulfurtransferase TusA family protein [Candidatus Margulisiibacteriota bacterium]
MKTIDIRNACCLVSAGLDKKLRELPSGEQVEVIIGTDVGEEMLSNVAQKENCEILETEIEGDIIRAVAKKK